MVRANALYQKGCDLQHGRSCARLARNYLDGTGVAQDVERALELYRRERSLYEPECENGIAMSCSALAGVYEEGRGVPVDQAKAQSLRRKACQLCRQEDCRSAR